MARKRVLTRIQKELFSLLLGEVVILLLMIKQHGDRVRSVTSHRTDPQRGSYEISSHCIRAVPANRRVDADGDASSRGRMDLWIRCICGTVDQG